ncbi:hypothetical protein [Streptomyces mutomycini]|uniref:hypothetical protein n=1 Tax=Streptomyces mutomycini TaxID=284036 RepID=UPI0033D5321A
MTDRDERIETYYHSGARELAEWLVDLEDEVEGLKKQVDFLYALETCGVDNWEGYSTAWQLSEGEITEDDI